MKEEQNESSSSSTTKSPSSSLLPSRSVIYASALSGITGRILFHPIDTIKARLQVQQNNLKTSIPIAATATINQQQYKNSWDAIRKMRTHEGIRGFYKGLGASLLFTAPAITLYLTFYDYFNTRLSSMLSSNRNVGESDDSRDHLSTQQDHMHAWKLAFSHLTSGFLAELFSCIVWVPHDVLKERLQVNRQNLRLRDVVQMVRTDGFRALYRGYGITLVTFGPQSAIYFMTYEKMKQWLRAVDDNDVITNKSSSQSSPSPLSSWAFLTSAAVASTVAGVAVCPLDVIKTRMQVQRRILSDGIGGVTSSTTSYTTTTTTTTTFYEGILHGLRTVYREEGWRALFKGLGPRIAYTVPNATIIMTMYEFVKDKLDQYYQQQQREQEQE